jgi:hypothetical protein
MKAYFAETNQVKQDAIRSPSASCAQGLQGTAREEAAII